MGLSGPSPEVKPAKSGAELRISNQNLHRIPLSVHQKRSHRRMALNYNDNSSPWPSVMHSIIIKKLCLFIVFIWMVGD